MKRSMRTTSSGSPRIMPRHTVLKRPSWCLVRMVSQMALKKALIFPMALGSPGAKGVSAR